MVALAAITEALHAELKPLGTDTLKAIAEQNAYVTTETQTWKPLSASTDFPA